MNTNTQTPRTDAAEQRDITGLGVVPVDFARKLERDLARVTAELKAVSLSAFTSIKNGSETMDALRSKITEYDTECTRLTDRVSSLEMERAALRARVAELDQKNMILRGAVEAVTAQREQAEQRVTELVAALRAIRDLDDDATAEDCAARAGSALASAESATPTTEDSSAVAAPAPHADTAVDCTDPLGACIARAELRAIYAQDGKDAND